MELADPAEEIKRLQLCISDLISVLALPAMWTGGEPVQIVRTLLDVLVGMLQLDLAYVRVPEGASQVPLELARVAKSWELPDQPVAIGELITHWLGDDRDQWVRPVRCTLETGVMSLVPLRLGLQGEMGLVVVGSGRDDFPVRTDRLLLSVAVNQAAMGLQSARLLGDQRRVAQQLDRRVAERTGEVAFANEELRKEIAERRLIEARLREEERELRLSEARKTAILDSALDCIVTIDHEGRITEFNPAAERTFGYRRDQVVGKPLGDVIVPPAHREAHQRGFARHLATGESRVLGRRVEMTAVRADGTEFPVELAISRIPLDGPPSFTGYLRDITARKQAEAELRRTAAFLAEAQRLSSTGSFFWRLASDELAWSDQVYLIFEFDPSEPVTLARIATRIHPDDRPELLRLIDRARADGGDFEYEHRLLMPDRTVRYLHLVAHARPCEDGTVEYIGAIQDVTERRLSEAALGKVSAELAHMARISSLGALTASIAHEVNQPLSGIITNASTCLRMLASHPPNIDGALETARRTIRDGRRASEVITRLRALFERKSVTTEPVDLNEAAREVIALSLSDLQRARVILLTQFRDDLPLVRGDRVQLQQVILNLIRNAAEAMADIEERPRNLVISTGQENEEVRLAVSDSGVGLGGQDPEQLFDPFYTTKESGMGIGLSVSRSIIESHGGRLWAAPNDGPGAWFGFTVPSIP